MPVGAERSYRVAGADPAAFDDVGAKPGVEQTFQHHLRSDELREVVARFTSLLAFAFDLANLKAMSDEGCQVDAADQHLPARLRGRKLELMLGL